MVRLHCVQAAPNLKAASKMPGFSVDVKGIAELSKTLNSKPLHASLRLRLSGKMTGLQKEIKTVVGRHYSITENIDKVSAKSFDRNTKKQITGFQLVYRYQKVPLSRYPVYQVRLTTKKRLMEVQRRKRGSFQQRVLPQEEETYTQTLVKIKKEFKLVVGKHGPDFKYGRPGFMGWLHTGKLNRARFRSSGIFERAQRETWSAGQRLPVFELYGPSFTEILNDKAVIQDITASPAFRELEGYLTKRVSVNG